MLKTLGIVEVRPNADLSRLTACRRLGGKSLLEWVVRAMTESLGLDSVIILAPDIAEAAELTELAPCDVPLLVSDRPDALARFAAAMDAYPARAVVRVAAEHPFVDPVLIDRLVTAAANHTDADYIGYCSRNGRPIVRSPLGAIGEWIRGSAIRRANRAALHAIDRDQVSSHFHTHPEQFNLRLIPIPRQLDRDDLRLTIGGEEDWERTQTIFEALGPEPHDYRRVADLLHHQPALRERMAVLNRMVGAM
jgi:spore coat polysaccharide biosynthesis protein SpsF